MNRDESRLLKRGLFLILFFTRKGVVKPRMEKIILMKKYFLFFISTFGFLLSSLTQNSQPKAVVADKIVAVVGDKVILKSDIDNSIIDMQRQNIEIPANGRCMVLEQAMGIKALVLQAEKDSLPVTDEEVENIIDNRIRGFL